MPTRVRNPDITGAVQRFHSRYRTEQERGRGKATITDKLGVDFGQFVLAPSLSKSFGPVALGVGPLVQLQRFKAYGFGAFGGLSKDPGSLSDRGSEYLFGGGVRGGAIWTVTPSLSLGVEVSSPIYMEKSTKYNGLFAEDGGFDVPAHFTVGLAQKLLPTLTIAFDYQKIFFGDVGALGNPAPTAAEFLGVITPERRFGGSKGIGFGWRNQDVYRLGLLWKPGGHWQWRVGYSQCSSQITTDAVLFNIPTPSVMSQKPAASPTNGIRAERCRWATCTALMTNAAPRRRSCSAHRPSCRPAGKSWNWPTTTASERHRSNRNFEALRRRIG